MHLINMIKQTIMRKIFLLSFLTIASATVFGQANGSRLSVFSGAGYNYDFNNFSFNIGTEYAYYLNDRIYVLGTFHSNFKGLGVRATVNGINADYSESVNIPVNNLRLQFGAGVNLFNPNSKNQLYLQGQAGLGYVFGSIQLPQIGELSYKSSMKTVGGSFGYDRKLNDRWVLGAAYTVDYNWLNITHGLICKVSYLF